MNSTFACAHCVKMDLFRKYEWIAAAGDRHLAEFVSGDMYLRNPQVVEEWKYSLTSVEWRRKDLLNRLDKSGRLASGEELSLEDTGEERIQLIKAICGLGNLVTNVNIPNNGRQIANLPTDAVVETNALFERDAIRPVIAGELPNTILDLIMPHVENHNRVIKAAKTYNYAMVLEAFQNDPQIRDRIEPKEMERQVHDMIEVTLH